MQQVLSPAALESGSPTMGSPSGLRAPASLGSQSSPGLLAAMHAPRPADTRRARAAAALVVETYMSPTYCMAGISVRVR